MSRFEELFQHLDEREISKYLLSEELNEKEIDYLVAQSADYYFGDLLDNSKMRNMLIRYVLDKEDYTLIYELFQCMYGEYTIPQDYIKILFEDDERYELQVYISGCFQLDYGYVKQILRKINNLVDFRDFLTKQELQQEDIEFILSNKFHMQFNSNLDEDFEEKIFDILIRFHKIPISILRTWIEEKHPKLSEIVEKQPLSFELQEIILSDNTLEMYHNIVIEKQDLSQSIIDEIISKGQWQNIYRLIFNQKLTKDQIEMIFNLENDLTEKVLQTQWFSEKQRAELILRFPQFRNIIMNNRESRKNLYNKIERRRKREYEITK